MNIVCLSRLAPQWLPLSLQCFYLCYWHNVSRRSPSVRESTSVSHSLSSSRWHKNSFVVFFLVLSLLWLPVARCTKIELLKGWRKTKTSHTTVRMLNTQSTLRMSNVAYQDNPNKKWLARNLRAKRVLFVAKFEMYAYVNILKAVLKDQHFKQTTTTMRVTSLDSLSIKMRTKAKIYIVSIASYAILSQPSLHFAAAKRSRMISHCCRTEIKSFPLSTIAGPCHATAVKWKCGENCVSDWIEVGEDPLKFSWQVVVNKFNTKIVQNAMVGGGKDVKMMFEKWVKSGWKWMWNAGC